MVITWHTSLTLISDFETAGKAVSVLLNFLGGNKGSSNQDYLDKLTSQVINQLLTICSIQESWTWLKVKFTKVQKIGCPCFSHEKISDEITLILIFVKTVTLLLFTNSVLVAPGISIWPRYTINTLWTFFNKIVHDQTHRERSLLNIGWSLTLSFLHQFRTF